MRRGRTWIISGAAGHKASTRPVSASSAGVEAWNDRLTRLVPCAVEGARAGVRDRPRTGSAGHLGESGRDSSHLRPRESVSWVETSKRVAITSEVRLTCECGVWVATVVVRRDLFGLVWLAADSTAGEQRQRGEAHLTHLALTHTTHQLSTMADQGTIQPQLSIRLALNPS